VGLSRISHLRQTSVFCHVLQQKYHNHYHHKQRTPAFPGTPRSNCCADGHTSFLRPILSSGLIWHRRRLHQRRLCAGASVWRTALPGSGGRLTASHRVGPDSIPGQIMCDSWSHSKHKSGSSASASISAVSHHCINAALPTIPEDGYTRHPKGRR